MGPALQPVPSRDVLFLCSCFFLLIFSSFFLSLACLRPWGPIWALIVFRMVNHPILSMSRYPEDCSV